MQSQRISLFPYTTLFRSRKLVPDLDATTWSAREHVVWTKGPQALWDAFQKIDPWWFDFLKRIPQRLRPLDRKSTRLNSSHVKISYAVFCLKKKKHEGDAR